jgi:hypothetical protein
MTLSLAAFGRDGIVYIIAVALDHIPYTGQVEVSHLWMSSLLSYLLLQPHALGTCSLSNASFIPCASAMRTVSIVPGPEPEDATILTLMLGDTVVLQIEGIARFAETEAKHGMVTATLGQEQGEAAPMRMNMPHATCHMPHATCCHVCPVAWVGYENGSLCAWRSVKEAAVLQVDVAVLGEAICALAASDSNMFVGGASDKLVWGRRL